MKAFQDNLFSIFDDCFPEKSRTISSIDEPFFTDKLMNIKRRKTREYHKHRRSQKYLSLKKVYKQS